MILAMVERLLGICETKRRLWNLYYNVNCLKISRQVVQAVAYDRNVPNSSYVQTLMSLAVLLCWYSLVWCPGWWRGMLGTLFGKHNSDPIRVTASSLGSCEGKSLCFVILSVVPWQIALLGWKCGPLNNVTKSHVHWQNEKEKCLIKGKWFTSIFWLIITPLVAWMKSRIKRLELGSITEKKCAQLLTMALMISLKTKEKGVWQLLSSAQCTQLLAMALIISLKTQEKGFYVTIKAVIVHSLSKCNYKLFSKLSFVKIVQSELTWSVPVSPMCIRR